ncbi:hypothetical protein [Haematomicrobium sanguinis]|uniref:hypothetical protein n=1 Tax=Haematomicrobium sanguinis TaxID=479106 RepID=UPI0012F85DE2|nr:hypothetical protein [Haematomicrobium sanguinis]
MRLNVELYGQIIGTFEGNNDRDADFAVSSGAPAGQCCTDPPLALAPISLPRALPVN